MHLANYGSYYLATYKMSLNIITIKLLILGLIRVLVNIRDGAKPANPAFLRNVTSGVRAGGGASTICTCHYQVLFIGISLFCFYFHLFF